MDTVSLTKQLIAIPSYVDSEVNESQIGEFIYQYLRSNTNLVVRKDTVVGNRCNIVAYTKACIQGSKFVVDTLFVDHIDTVQPKRGWNTDQFQPTEKGSRLYGLGAADTKANVAVLMNLATKVEKGRHMFLFYIDEEYDFLGVKSFIKTYSDTLTVKRIISADGENLQIRISCRGFFEIDVEMYGKSGHSANPKNGVSVIKGFSKVMSRFEKYLTEATVNIAYVRGGMYKDRIDNTVMLGRNGNNIPDFLEATIEVRTNGSTSLKTCSEKLRQFCQKEGITLKTIHVRHDLPAWSSDREQLATFLLAVEKSGVKCTFTNPSTSGYVDLALLANAFTCPCACFGVVGGNRHGADEWVDIASITVVEKVFDIFLRGSYGLL